LTTERKVALLRPWQEVTGVLEDFDLDMGFLRFNRCNIMIPPVELGKIPELKELIGRRIGVLRTDMPNRPLLVRVVDKVLGDGDGIETGFWKA